MQKIANEQAKAKMLTDLLRTFFWFLRAKLSLYLKKKIILPFKSSRAKKTSQNISLFNLKNIFLVIE